MSLIKIASNAVNAFLNPHKKEKNHDVEKKQHSLTYSPSSATPSSTSPPHSSVTAPSRSLSSSAPPEEELIQMKFSDFIGEAGVDKKDEPKPEAKEEAESEDIALKKIETLDDDDYKAQLMALHACFLMIKQYMNIPSKTIREKLSSAESINAGQAIQMRLILQDKIVLHHVQYIDDIDELIRIVEQIKKSPEDKKRGLNKYFNNKIKFILNDIHHKEEYLLAKKPHLPTLDLEKIDEAFEKYCDRCSYHLSTIIPKVFLCDTQLYNLSVVEKDRYKDLNTKLHRYFGNKLITEQRRQPKANIQYQQNTLDKIEGKSQTAKEYILTAREKITVNMTNAFDSIRKLSAESVGIGQTQGVRELDKIGQELLGDDSVLKDTLKEIRARVAVIQNAFDACHEKKLALIQLQREIRELQPKSNLMNLLTDSNNILSAYNNTQTAGIKDLEEFYNLEKGKFEDEITKLTVVKENLAALKNHEQFLIDEQSRQNDLIRQIHAEEQRLALRSSLSISVDTARNNFVKLAQELKTWKDNFSTKNVKDLATLLTECDAVVKKRKDKTAELEEVLAQLQQYGETRKYLKGKTLSSQQIDERFAHIKEQAQHYWAQAMQVQFEPEANAANEHVPLIIANYNSDAMQSRLDEALKEGSFTTKLLSGITAVGVGAAFGATIGGASKLLSLNPFSAAGSAGVGAVLGGAIGGVLYSAWLSSQNKNDTKELRKQFMKEMEGVGFNNDEYTKLINSILKLLIHRDCVLLNEKLNKGDEESLRSQFIKDNELDGKNEDEINLAIEIFFSKQLNTLINESFIRIYDLHEEDINNARKQNAMVEFIKKFFQGSEEYSKKRQICTTQMQIAFLEGIAHCLETSKDALSKKYRNICLTTATVFTGIAIGLGIALGIGAIAVTAASGVGIAIGVCVLGALAALAATRYGKARFKRSESDRQSLQVTIGNLRNEAKRLKKTAEEIVDTGLEHQKSLKKLADLNNAPNIFQKIFSLLTCKDMEAQQIAMGTADVWLREWSERYRHSIFMEVDFQGTMKPLITRAAKQTQDLQQELVAYMILTKQNQPNRYSLTLLNKFITDTTAFFQAQNGAQFELRRTLEGLFDIKEKIKEQVLEIVSVIPLEHGDLPQDLINFYINVLHGSPQDLDFVRRLHTLDAIRTAVGETTEAKDEKQAEKDVKAEESLKDKMESQHARILGGSYSYRIKLGAHNNNDWGDAALVHADDVEEDVITADNIKQYLANSLAFLLSLDARTPEDILPDNLDAEYTHTSKYIIYRAMLLKQLAEFVDPAHEKYQPALKDAIFSFAKDKLLLSNPKKFFSEIQHQDRVVPKNSAPAEQKEGDNNNLDKTYNDSIVDAIRVNLTYDTTKMSAKNFIRQNIASDLVKKDLLFGLTNDPNKNILDKLGMPTNRHNIENLQNTIINTEKLFYAILVHPTLRNFKVHEVYLNAVMEHVNTLDNKVSLRLKTHRLSEKESAHLTHAQSALQLHKQKLLLILALLKEEGDMHVNHESGEEKHNTLPELHFTSHRSVKGVGLFASVNNIPVGPPDNAKDDDIKSALLKALCDHAGNKDKPIQFNLGCLQGEDTWKKYYLNILKAHDKIVEVTYCPT